MPEHSYISLACKKLGVDPQSLLSFHEYPDRVVIITAEGKKISFTFADLEDYHQYLEDNRSGAEIPSGLTRDRNGAEIPSGLTRDRNGEESRPVLKPQAAKKTKAAKKPQSAKPTKP